MRGPRRLGHRQNPLPQNPFQFSDRLSTTITFPQDCRPPRFCSDPGAGDHCDAEILPELAGLPGLRGHDTAQAGQGVEREAAPRHAISPRGIAHRARAHQGEERLNPPHALAARAIRIGHLVEKAKERAPHRVNLLAAVGAFVPLGQPPGGQERAEELVKVNDALPAEGLDAPAREGRKAFA